MCKRLTKSLLPLPDNRGGGEDKTTSSFSASAKRKFAPVPKSSTYSLTTSSTHMQKQMKNVCMDLLWEHLNSSLQGKVSLVPRPLPFSLVCNLIWRQKSCFYIAMPIILNTNQEQKLNQMDRNFASNCFLYPRVVKPGTSGSCFHGFNC